MHEIHQKLFAAANHIAVINNNPDWYVRLGLRPEGYHVLVRYKKVYDRSQIVTWLDFEQNINNAILLALEKCKKHINHQIKSGGLKP